MESILKQLFMVSWLLSCGWTRVHQANPQLCRQKIEFNKD